MLSHIVFLFITLSFNINIVIIIGISIIGWPYLERFPSLAMSSLEFFLFFVVYFVYFSSSPLDNCGDTVFSLHSRPKGEGIFILPKRLPHPDDRWICLYCLWNKFYWSQISVTVTGLQRNIQRFVRYSWTTKDITINISSYIVWAILQWLYKNAKNRPRPLIIKEYRD